MRSKCCYHLLLLLMFFFPFSLTDYLILSDPGINSFPLDGFPVRLLTCSPFHIWYRPSSFLFALCVIFLNFWTLNLTLSFVLVKTKKTIP